MATKKNTAKTAAKTAKTAKGGFEYDPTMARLIPLGAGANAGDWAYVSTLDGRTVKCAVHSATFIELIEEIAGAGVAARRSAEVAEWTAAVAAPATAARWTLAARTLRGEAVDADDAGTQEAGTEPTAVAS